MSIWIDQPIWPRHGTVFAHLVSDTSLVELHEFAIRARLAPRSFEGDHYDVPRERYAAVLAAGATSTTGGDVVRKLQASGLRLRKRKGDEPVARVRGVAFPDGTVADVDLVVSGQPLTVPGIAAALVFLRDREGRFAVVHAVRRDAWGSPGGGVEPGESAGEAAIREVLEETGLALEVEDVRAVAYERFEAVGELRGHWVTGRSYVQVYLADLDRSEPTMRASEDDVDGWRWVDLAEFEALCGREFWWPLVLRLFT